MSKIYHSNGNLAYDPDFGKIYHSNGKLAYDPDFGKIYHSNGNLAYDPYYKKVYHLNGNLAYVGSSLELELGVGIKWNFNSGDWKLYAYGKWVAYFDSLTEIKVAEAPKLQKQKEKELADEKFMKELYDEREERENARKKKMDDVIKLHEQWNAEDRQKINEKNIYGQLKQEAIDKTEKRRSELKKEIDKVENNILSQNGQYLVLGNVNDNKGIASDEGTSFEVILLSAGHNKLSVIKLVMELTGLGLKEAKDLVDGAPKPLKERVSKEEAEALKKHLISSGAIVEIK